MMILLMASHQSDLPPLDRGVAATETGFAINDIVVSLMFLPQLHFWIDDRVEHIRDELEDHVNDCT